MQFCYCFCTKSNRHFGGCKCASIQTQHEYFRAQLLHSSTLMHVGPILSIVLAVIIAECMLAYSWSTCIHFEVLLLARYVPNVAKRSIWDQCKKKYILRTDRRPTSHLGKFQMAISARGCPIYNIMFGSRMGFSRSSDRMALIPVWPNSIGMWDKTMCEVGRSVTI